MQSRTHKALIVIILLTISLAGCELDLNAVSPYPEGDMSIASSPLRVMVELVVLILEIAGIGVIVLGMAVASAAYGYRLLKHGVEMSRYERYREHLGQVILLGLEFLVAADIVGTVAVAPTIQNVGTLAIIIIIRTFLSFTLEVETTGYWPWERRRFHNNGSTQGQAP
jgi:uncharacterized membrane protein